MRIFTKEHRRKISIAKKGKVSTFKGKHHSDESNEKNRMAHLGKCLSEEHKRKIGKGNTGKIRTKKMRERYSRAKKGIPKSKEHKENLSAAKMGTSNRKQSKIMKRMWKNPEFARKQLKAMYKGRRISPNRPERRLRNGLNKMFPNEYKFVGDGQVWIGGRSPDFINVNGQKKIIELFGDFWHGEKYTGRTKKQEENRRIQHFAKYGFQTLIVWQRELKNIKQLKRKLKSFN